MLRVPVFVFQLLQLFASPLSRRNFVSLYQRLWGLFQQIEEVQAFIFG
jgi:hypothetical protein